MLFRILCGKKDKIPGKICIETTAALEDGDKSKCHYQVGKETYQGCLKKLNDNQYTYHSEYYTTDYNRLIVQTKDKQCLKSHKLEKFYTPKLGEECVVCKKRFGIQTLMYSCRECKLLECLECQKLEENKNFTKQKKANHESKLKQEIRISKKINFKENKA